MSENRKFYRLKDDGETKKNLEQFIANRQTTKQAWFDFADKHGAKEIWQNHSLMAIKLDRDKVPLGWSANKDLPGGFYKPTRRKVCMCDYIEFKGLPRMPDGWELSSALGIDVVHTGRAAHFPSFEFIGDDMFLSLHNDSDDIPSDVIQLKMSEYWRLKEAHEQAA